MEQARLVVDMLFRSKCDSSLDSLHLSASYGLGLAICERQTIAMGTTMQVTSSIGSGSKFRFAVTLQSDGSHQNLQAVHTDYDTIYILVRNARYARVLHQYLTATPTRAPVTTTILQMEDSPQLNKILRNNVLLLIDSEISNALPLGDLKVGKIVILQSLEACMHNESLLATKNVQYIRKPIKYHELLSILANRALGPMHLKETVESMQRDLQLKSVFVLIVDDSIVDRKITQKMLQQAGISNVHIAVNGEDALSWCGTKLLVSSTIAPLLDICSSNSLYDACAFSISEK